MHKLQGRSTCFGYSLGGIGFHKIYFSKYGFLCYALIPRVYAKTFHTCKHTDSRRLHGSRPPFRFESLPGSVAGFELEHAIEKARESSSSMLAYDGAQKVQDRTQAPALQTRKHVSLD